MPYSRDVLGFEFVQEWPVLCMARLISRSRNSWKGTLMNVEMARVVLEEGTPVMRLRTELDPEPPELALQGVEHLGEQHLRDILRKYLVEFLGEHWQRPGWWKTTPEATRFQDDPALWEKDWDRLVEQYKAAEAQQRQATRQARMERLRQETQALNTRPTPPSLDRVLEQAGQALQKGENLTLTPELLMALVSGLLDVREELATLKKPRQ